MSIKNINSGIKKTKPDRMHGLDQLKVTGLLITYVIRDLLNNNSLLKGSELIGFFITSEWELCVKESLVEGLT